VPVLKRLFRHGDKRKSHLFPSYTSSCSSRGRSIVSFQSGSSHGDTLTPENSVP